MMNVSFLSIPWSISQKHIFATLYYNNTNTKVLLLAWGCPSTWKQYDIKKFIDLWYDIVIPEYLWFLRSDGLFTPDWCIETIETTRDYIIQWELYDVQWTFVIWKKYNSIYYIGFSFWGMRSCYFKSWCFDQYYLLAPLLTPWSLEAGEETLEDFYYAMQYFYPHVYRWFDQQTWSIFFENHTMYLDQLKDKSICILHGKKDFSIRHHRSEHICTVFPHIQLHLYPYIKHSSSPLLRKLYSII